MVSGSWEVSSSKSSWRDAVSSMGDSSMDAKTLAEGVASGEPSAGALVVESMESGGSSGSTLMSG
eukprot:2544150-Pleurochrysis_carterae.AAC.1